jgi:hypothetical protein
VKFRSSSLRPNQPPSSRFGAISAVLRRGRGEDGRLFRRRHARLGRGEKAEAPDAAGGRNERLDVATREQIARSSAVTETEAVVAGGEADIRAGVEAGPGERRHRRIDRRRGNRSDGAAGQVGGTGSNGQGHQCDR